MGKTFDIDEMTSEPLVGICRTNVRAVCVMPGAPEVSRRTTLCGMIIVTMCDVTSVDCSASCYHTPCAGSDRGLPWIENTCTCPIIQNCIVSDTMCAGHIALSDLAVPFNMRSIACTNIYILSYIQNPPDYITVAQWNRRRKWLALNTVTL